ncbi:uncharacterized protein [Apostichopus japonicus]|uniref:uncharacterized protein n=1 Tax=Stichopus japonicus TaxID=307972 RepID=UPI003AB3F8F4
MAITADQGDDFGGDDTIFVTIPKLVGTINVNIVIINDFITEDTETFQVIITDVDEPLQIGSSCTTVITIVDDDIQPMISLDIIPPSVIEDASAIILIEMSSPLSFENVTVSLHYEAITASENADYQIITSSVMISAGEVAGSSNVVILDDDVIEMNENFIISIAGVHGNAVANPTMSTVTVTIEDNDIGKARN